MLVCQPSNGSGGSNINAADYQMWKLKMPILEGYNAHAWIYRAEQYFEIQGLMQSELLRAATSCLDEKL